MRYHTLLSWVGVRVVPIIVACSGRGPHEPFLSLSTGATGEGGTGGEVVVMAGDDANGGAPVDTSGGTGGKRPSENGGTGGTKVAGGSGGTKASGGTGGKSSSHGGS